jgi:hypothetical protein
MSREHFEFLIEGIRDAITVDYLQLLRSMGGNDPICPVGGLMESIEATLLRSPWRRCGRRVSTSSNSRAYMHAALGTDQISIPYIKKAGKLERDQAVRGTRVSTTTILINACGQALIQQRCGCRAVSDHPHWQGKSNAHALRRILVCAVTRQ